MISTDFKEFVAVVENGGFTVTANALDVSISLVSRQPSYFSDNLWIWWLNNLLRLLLESKQYENG